MIGWILVKYIQISTACLCVCASASVCVCVTECVRLMTSSDLTPVKVMCQCSLVASPWRYVSCQRDGLEADKKNCWAEERMNREDWK